MLHVVSLCSVILRVTTSVLPWMMDRIMGGVGGADVLWQRMEGADLPPQMEVKLSESLAPAGGGTW